MHTPYLYPQPTRPVAMAVNGMVSAAHPLASTAGLRVLMDGGNAFDAAVATAAVLNVVEPYMSGMGGIGVGLAYVADEGRVRALDFSGCAPQAARPALYSEETMETGILAAMVPGNVAGWLTLQETYGRLDRQRLFEPAIDYAENGIPITYLNSAKIVDAAYRLRQFPASASIMLDGDGSAPPPGTRLRMTQLAESLRAVAEGGKEAFYRGDLARRIVEASNGMGGIYSLEDFSRYEARWVEPISVRYRGFDVFTAPPNSSGFQVLQTLKLLETFGRDELSFQHPDTLHATIESVKLSMTDRARYAGDPDHVDIPLDGLLSDSYAMEQRKRIDMANASSLRWERYTADVPEGSLVPGDAAAHSGGMTTHFAAADGEGNVVTITQTLGGAFGSAVAIGDTGIFLNNMTTFFDLDPASPNVIGPGKRVDFVVAPTQTLRDGRFLLSMGTPGGYGIHQTTTQMLVNVLDFGMNVQQAVDSPRFKCSPGREIEMEERFPRPVRAALAARGHDVKVVDAWWMGVGGAHAIRYDADQRVFQGGADPRRDGHAAGW